MTKLKATLIKDEKDALELFSKLNVGRDVANFLEIPYGQLLYLLYKQPEKNKYISFSIPKKTKGHRTISKPSKGIDILQKKLKPYLDAYYRVKAPVHGFVKGKSVVSNASNHLNVKRSYIRNIRAMLNDWKSNGAIEAEKNYIKKHHEKHINVSDDKLDGSYFCKVFYGKLSFLKMVRNFKEKNDSVVTNFALKAGEIDPDPPKYIKEIMKMSKLFDVFIGHASEDKDLIAKPIYDACESKGIAAFIDVIHIDWGDSLTEKIKAMFALSVEKNNQIF